MLVYKLVFNTSKEEIGQPTKNLKKLIRKLKQEHKVT